MGDTFFRSCQNKIDLTAKFFYNFLSTTDISLKKLRKKDKP